MSPLLQIYTQIPTNQRQDGLTWVDGVLLGFRLGPAWRAGQEPTYSIPTGPASLTSVQAGWQQLTEAQQRQALQHIQQQQSWFLNRRCLMQNQLALPGSFPAPAPAAPLVRTFDGHPVTVVEWQGRQIFFVDEIAAALGYDAPRYLTDQLSREWSDEAEEGVEIVTLTNGDIKAIEQIRNDSVKTTESNPTPTRGGARKLIVLTEAGVNLVCIKTEKPAGKALRRWLAREVLPSIRQTGSYQTGKTKAPRGPSLLQQMKATQDSAERMLRLKTIGKLEASRLIVDAAETVCGPLPSMRAVLDRIASQQRQETESAEAAARAAAARAGIDLVAERLFLRRWRDELGERWVEVGQLLELAGHLVDDRRSRRSQLCSLGILLIRIADRHPELRWRRSGHTKRKEYYYPTTA
jgi:prophage antirepressor-like protein